MNTEKETIARRQAIFDKVFTHLKNQGRASYADDHMTKCAYRGSGGTKCAIGILIPDDKYEPYMEICSASDDNIMSVTGFDMDMDRDFAQQLQFAHDRAWANSFMYGIMSAMKNIARQYNLSDSIVTN